VILRDYILPTPEWSKPVDYNNILWSKGWTYSNEKGTMNKRDYKDRHFNTADLVKWAEEGKGMTEIMKLSGKNNQWIKDRLVGHYGNRIEFKPGRAGGIFIDGAKK
jgi:hypothetical protein